MDSPLIAFQMRKTKEIIRKYLIYLYFGDMSPVFFFLFFGLVLAYPLMDFISSNTPSIVSYIWATITVLAAFRKAYILFITIPLLIKSLPLANYTVSYSFFNDRFRTEKLEGLHEHIMQIPYKSISRIQNTREFLLIYSGREIACYIYKPDCDRQTLAALRDLFRAIKPLYGKDWPPESAFGSEKKA